ncbi:1-acyl-sn-glycerol-3-phosphate acyltransferase [Sanyastnella coralliicola]|uniref:1-acyl-sn-glycerol-3-phosphate acyltransferase n=1 Tax=Sanyastnella coralliicola TaxID=3069118 RepID=UPI0027B890CF|nr:1-acyl-sn-glycerol-3-phosphate acyltransferase [Longitalea sp. SCSIO 12813]
MEASTGSAIDVNEFDSIRPYRTDELPEVIERVLDQPSFFKIMKYIYPDLDEEDIKEMMADIKTPEQFQEEISGPAFKVITQTTTNGLSISNLDHIEHGKAYLYLSNHRDIILDSALLNVSLLEKGYSTTEIAIGDNLLRHQLIHDLVRLNKSFIVNRSVNPKEMLASSKRLGNYIHKTIREDETSIWIAHKEGRSKDGDDRTASGLLKMLVSGTDESIDEALSALNIVPMVVSYEYDPCDIFKANELMAVREHGSYNKREGEDYMSALAGITGHKGRVNIAIGRKLERSLERLPADAPKNELYKLLSQEIDRRMHLMYKLWPTNYIAYDILHGTREHNGHYTKLQRIAFRNYIRGRIVKLLLMRKGGGILKREGFIRQAREVMLQMYANPVVNQRDASEEPVY